MNLCKKGFTYDGSREDGKRHYNKQAMAHVFHDDAISDLEQIIQLLSEAGSYVLRSIIPESV